MKKFLLISQSQDGSYVNLIKNALSKSGYSLTVFTGKFSDVEKDVEIVEAPKYDSTSFKSRFKTCFSYVRSAKKYLKSNIDKFDAVMFTSNPPVNQSLVKFAQSKKKKCIYLIWDIYPDCIEKSFGKKVTPITAVWRSINRKMYEKCDQVLTIGEVMREHILQSYPKLDVKVIPYHTDTGYIHPIDKDENIFVKQNELEGKKVFMYSGKMGFGHGFDEMLNVAELLKDRDDIRFLFIGHGMAFEPVKKHIEDNGLSNTKILTFQPLKMLPYSLGSADVSFITIREQTDGLFLPSKVYDAMASGSAIICISGGKNDVSKLMEDNEIGVHVKTSSVDELKAAVLKLADDEEFLERCKKNAVGLAVRDYDIKTVTEQYRRLFDSMI